MEINNISDKEFKVIVTKMLTELGRTTKERDKVNTVRKK